MKKKFTPAKEETKGGNPLDHVDERAFDRDKKGDFIGFGQPGVEDEDPYANDEKTYQDHFRKTFITQN